MDWMNLIGSTEFLRKLFPKAPSLHHVRLLEIGLHQDGPRMLIRFDLNEFPVEPPAKWVHSRANRVQIRLMAIGVRELEIHGWSANNLADIEVAAASPDGVRLVAQGDGFCVKGLFDHVAIDGVSAYCDAPKIYE